MKYRIVKKFYRSDYSKEVKSYYRLEEYINTSFWSFSKPKYKWVASTQIRGFGEYSLSEEITYDTLKKAKESLRKITQEVHKDEIIKF